MTPAVTKTVATAGKRVLFDARPGDNCVTGIGRYARTMKTLLKGVAGHHCFVLGEDLKWSPRSAVEEELELPAILEREKIDIFHSPLFHLPAVLPCKAIVTIHDAIPIVRPDLSNPEFRKLFEERARDACERADAVVCPSEHAKKDVVAALGVPAEKVHVIYETPAPHFRVLDRPRAGGFFLVVGSIEKRKNPRVVLEALACLPKAERPRVVFVGPEAEYDLKAEALELGVYESVQYRGVVTDEELVALYNDADAIICPSHYEGFGLPVIEAFACGAAVLASNRAALPEVAGDAAHIFDPTDCVATREAIRSVGDALRTELRSRSVQRSKIFEREVAAASITRLYTKVEPAGSTCERTANRAPKRSTYGDAL